MEYLNYVCEKVFCVTMDDTQAGFYTPRKVVCFGNVLLDRIVQLQDPDVLQRHGLELRSKGEMELSKLTQIVTEASSTGKSLTKPGGSALNTVRILRQLGTDAQFFGAVGADKQAEELRDTLQSLGVEARLQTIEEQHTGQCVCLMYQDNPTLCANIGASAHFSLDQLKQTAADEKQTFLRPLARKQILYIEGFFVPQREQICDYIMTHFVRERRRLAVNLSAPYIVQQNAQMLLRMAQRAFFVCGNQQEFAALCLAADCKSMEELAPRLLQHNGEKQIKIIVVTNGSDGVLLITNYVEELSPPGELTFEYYRAPHVDKVVDATGAGDAFVASFFHAWLEKKRSICESMRVAMDVAAKVVTQVGCTLPTN